MNDSSTRVGGMIWAGYALLLLFSFSLYWSLLLWAGLAALALGYYQRRQARKLGQEAECAHAQWQVNTVWLALILALVGLGGIVGVAGWMGNDPTIMAKLDELSAGDQPPLEILRQFWAIPAARLWWPLCAVLPCCILCGLSNAPCKVFCPSGRGVCLPSLALCAGWPCCWPC